MRLNIRRPFGHGVLSRSIEAERMPAFASIANSRIVLAFTLVIGAVAKAADQEADGERDGGDRVWALLDHRAQEIAGFAGPFSDSFGGISRTP
jgi:hypothetical protein